MSPHSASFLFFLKSILFPPKGTCDCYGLIWKLFARILFGLPVVCCQWPCDQWYTPSPPTSSLTFLPPTLSSDETASWFLCYFSFPLALVNFCQFLAASHLDLCLLGEIAGGWGGCGGKGGKTSRTFRWVKGVPPLFLPLLPSGCQHADSLNPVNQRLLSRMVRNYFCTKSPCPSKGEVSARWACPADSTAVAASLPNFCGLCELVLAHSCRRIWFLLVFWA